ncbi:MAG: exonuclease domain-containing protein [Candidatus Omnitrophota bacterium]|jgi:DNA polymerase III epsilon subunit family exonuclease
MPKDIRTVEFTVFDLETTGLNPHSGDRIVEIAAVRLRDGRAVKAFQSLVNPEGKRISPAAFAVNQISDQMLKEAPRMIKAMPVFLDFISDSCLASYNASFDFDFLSSELRLINRQLPTGLQIVDILTMARRMLPGLERYALGCVAKHLGIDSIQEHRALSDAQLATRVFNHLSAKLVNKGVVDFEQFISLFGLNSQLLDNINNAKIARIQEALNLGVSLKIRYLSRHNTELTEREVIPQTIFEQRNQTYLVGYCNLRNKERTFRVKNILQLEISNK